MDILKGVKKGAVWSGHIAGKGLEKANKGVEAAYLVAEGEGSLLTYRRRVSQLVADQKRAGTPVTPEEAGARVMDDMILDMDGSVSLADLKVNSREYRRLEGAIIEGICKTIPGPADPHLNFRTVTDKIILPPVPLPAITVHAPTPPELAAAANYIRARYPQVKPAKSALNSLCLCEQALHAHLAAFRAELAAVPASMGPEALHGTVAIGHIRGFLEARNIIAKIVEKEIKQANVDKSVQSLNKEVLNWGAYAFLDGPAAWLKRVASPFIKVNDKGVRIGSAGFNRQTLLLSLRNLAGGAVVYGAGHAAHAGKTTYQLSRLLANYIRSK